LSSKARKVARNGDNRQLAGDARQQGWRRSVDDPLDRDVILQPVAQVTDLGVLAAADEFEQDRVRSSIGNFERVEVVQRRKFLVAPDRQPIVEHRHMPRPLVILDRSKRGKQRLRGRLFSRLHARLGRSHVFLRCYAGGSLRRCS
jgi:hypothetical protein